MNSDSPRCPCSRRGRCARAAPARSARPANVPHAFAPLISQPCLPLALRAGVALHCTDADVRPDVRLGDRRCRRAPRPTRASAASLLLRLGAALEQRPREDLRARQQAARDQRGRRQLLRQHDHRQVAHLGAAVLVGHGAAEEAQLGELLDQRLRDQQVLAVDAVGQRASPSSSRSTSCFANCRANARVCVASSLSRSTLFSAARVDHARADAAQPRVVEAGADQRPHVVAGVRQVGEIARVRLRACRGSCARPRRRRRTPRPRSARPRAPRRQPLGVADERPRRTRLGGDAGQPLAEHLVVVDLSRPPRSARPRAR